MSGVREILDGGDDGCCCCCCCCCSVVVLTGCASAVKLEDCDCSSRVGYLSPRSTRKACPGVKTNDPFVIR